MKKVLLLTFLSLVGITSLNAQSQKAYLKKNIARIEKHEAILKKQKQDNKQQLKTLISKEASEQAKQQFIIDFGNYPVSLWERTNQYDEATFVKDGREFTAYYNFDTKLLGTTTIKNFYDLPEKAQYIIKDTYKSYTVGDIIEYDHNDTVPSNMMFFNQEVDDSDNYFVELKRGVRTIVVLVNNDGEVSYFTRLK
jgi:hypothetical protein